jgi:hypothetical protein
LERYNLLTLLLYISFPLLCILAIPPASRPGALAQRLVFGIALYEFLLFAGGMALGLTNHLTPRAYGAFTWSAALVLLAQSWRNGIRFDPAFVLRWIRTRRGTAAVLLAGIMTIAFALQLGFDTIYGTRHYDGLWYHIPRMIFWLQQQGFAAWTTPVWQQIGLPAGADVVLGQKIMLGLGWNGIGYVTLLLSVGAIACIYIAALDLHLSRWHAAMTAILFSSFPGVGLRIWSVNSDMAAAFPVLASFVVLHRVRDMKHGLALFMLLNSLAIACKPTVAPLALLLGCIALWQCRKNILSLRKVALPCAALLMAVVIVASSFWPVYATFSDILGGNYGRGIKVASVAEFSQAVTLSTGHWLLEPLGYLTPIRERLIKGIAKTVYTALGAEFKELPERYKPWPSQDVGRTGLASILMLPLLLAGLPRRAGIGAALLLLLGYMSSSGMIRFEPYNARYIVVFLAGFALLWGGSRLFQHGKRRWVLTAMVTLNVCALIGVVATRFYLDANITSQPGRAYHYLADDDRKTIAGTLAGRPLLVITNESLDALLVGTGIDYPLNYLICPADGDWEREMRKASLKSNWLALVHDGRKSMLTGPIWDRPGSHSCTEQVSTQQLEDALSRAGWQHYRRDQIVDLWRVL